MRNLDVLYFSMKWYDCMPYWSRLIALDLLSVLKRDCSDFITELNAHNRDGDLNGMIKDVQKVRRLTCGTMHRIKLYGGIEA